MKTWTIEEMLDHEPCTGYDRARLESLWDGREQLSVLEILDLDIPAEHRIWAALTAGPHVGPAVEQIVTRAVRTHALHCGVPEVENWAARWLSGEDRTDKKAAREVKREAARKAERAAAEAAWAWWVSERSATWAAWVASLCVEAAAGAGAEARDAELQRQIEDIRSAAEDK